MQAYRSSINYHRVPSDGESWLVGNHLFLKCKMFLDWSILTGVHQCCIFLCKHITVPTSFMFVVESQMCVRDTHNTPGDDHPVDPLDYCFLVAWQPKPKYWPEMHHSLILSLKKYWTASQTFVDEFCKTNPEQSIPVLAKTLCLMYQIIT